MTVRDLARIAGNVLFVAAIVLVVVCTVIGILVKFGVISGI